MDFPLTLQESVTAVEFLMLSSCCALFSNIFCSAASHVFWTASTQGIPSEAAYLDATVEKARERGYAETMFGRKRHIPELHAGNANLRGFGERTAMNHPMQGSAADIIKLAMIEVSRRLREEGFAAKLLIQVHDELDFSVPRSEVEALSAMVREVMEGVVELKVPLIADVSNAPTWAEAH